MFALAGFAWSQKITDQGGPLYIIRMVKLPVWIRKPLYECGPCVSGQMALWCSYLYMGKDIVTTAIILLGAVAVGVLLEVWVSK